jgi:hypothetical protein
MFYEDESVNQAGRHTAIIKTYAPKNTGPKLKAKADFIEGRNTT